LPTQARRREDALDRQFTRLRASCCSLLSESNGNPAKQQTQQQRGYDYGARHKAQTHATS